MKNRIFFILSLVIIFICFAIPIFSLGSYYELSYSIIYVDESGAEIYESVNGKVDMSQDDLEIVSPTIPGYILKNESDNVITYQNLNITYSSSQYVRKASGEKVVVYEKLKQITVFQKYYDGRTAYPKTTLSGKEGNGGTFTSLQLEGYSPDIPSFDYVFGIDSSFTITYYPIKYTITYVLNNGSDNIIEMKNHNETYSIISTIPYKEGYVFSFWDDKKGTSYHYGDEIKNNENITLYANYSVSFVYLRYDGNGGECNIPTVQKEYMKDIYISSIIPIRDSYEFLGWGYNRDSNIVAYMPGDIYRENISRTLFAIWQEKSYNVISYDLNGGYGDFPNQYKNINETIFLHVSIPQKDNYIFYYWIGNDGYEYSPGEDYYKNEDLSLFAYYVEKPKDYFTITYNANGGDFDIEKESFSSIPCYISSSYPNKEGYLFAGWSIDNSDKIMYYPGSKYNHFEDITLYAVYYDYDSAYSVIYNNNGGYDGPNNQVKIKNVDLILSSVIPKRDDYTFLYWCTNAHGTGIVYNPSETYKDNKPLTLYAIWESNIEEYTISYFTYPSSDIIESQTKLKNEIVHISSVIPKYDGYTFLGWGEEYYSNVKYNPCDEYSLDCDLYLYAIWEEDESIIEYTIIYDANGGNNAPSIQTKKHDEIIYISSVKPSFGTKTFIGWAFSPYSNVVYYGGEEYANNESIYLYAIYDDGINDYSVDSITLSKEYGYINEKIYSSIILSNNGDLDGMANVNVYIDDIIFFSSSYTILSKSSSLLTIMIPLSPYSYSTHTIKAIINEDMINIENDINNNKIEKSFSVLKIQEIKIEYIDNTSTYIEGEDAFASFVIKNSWENDVLIEDNLSCLIEAFVLGSTGKEYLLYPTEISNIVIPSNEQNVVYLRFSIPNNYASKHLFVKGTLQSPILDVYKDITCESTILPNEKYTCAKTSFVSGNSVYKTNLYEYTKNVYAYSWSYENDQFVKKTYSFSHTPNVYIYPSSNSPYHEDNDGNIIMKSGYPIEVIYSIDAKAFVDGIETSIDEYLILPSSPTCVYPEYMFKKGDNISSSLEKTSYIYFLPENIDDIERNRNHYTFLNQEDGEYYVYVISGMIKTPFGAMSSICKSNDIKILSSLYSDWYHGE